MEDHKQMLNELISNPETCITPHYTNGSLNKYDIVLIWNASKKDKEEFLCAELGIPIQLIEYLLKSTQEERERLIALSKINHHKREIERLEKEINI